MTTLMTETATSVYSVRPFALIPIDGDAADHLDALLDALNRDGRAHGAACSYDYERRELSAIFQVDVSGARIRDLTTANDMAITIFDRALAVARIDARTAGLSIVEGDDPDLLP